MSSLLKLLQVAVRRYWRARCRGGSSVSSTRRTHTTPRLVSTSPLPSDLFSGVVVERPKVHYANSGAHGAIGLALIAQGKYTHPKVGRLDKLSRRRLERVYAQGVRESVGGWGRRSRRAAERWERGGCWRCWSDPFLIPLPSSFLPLVLRRLFFLWPSFDVSFHNLDA
jgi:hypothetical protein